MNDHRLPRRHARFRALALPAVLVVTLGITACSGNDNGSTTPSLKIPQGTLRASTNGDKCDDPAGDMTDDPRAASGNLSEPAGIDLLHSEAKLDDTNLSVVIQTAGPIASAANPLFVVL